MPSTLGYSKQYKTDLQTLVQAWAHFRRERDDTALLHFKRANANISNKIATYALFALQQMLATISESCNKATKNKITTKELIKEVDWLMNQLIRGNAEPRDPFLMEDVNLQDQLSFQKHLNKHAAIVNKIDRPTIAIIDDQASVSLAIEKTLQGFAFNTFCFKSISDFKLHQQNNHVDLVLLDVVMPDVTQTEVFDFAAQLLSCHDIKVISCSGKFTFDTRLDAVRANVADYIVKPINPYVLIEKISKALDLQRSHKHRLVIVDDQAAMGTYYKVMLEQVGCDVTFFDSATHLFQSLDDLNPDMFLLDLMMPDVDGLEVAKMIRQEQKFNFTPILFITADELIETRLNAINAGADDVIIKSTPIQAITQQILIRLERAYHIKETVARDALTGVLNHAQIVESANQVIKRVRRKYTDTALAVLDLDKFKSVNDTYGHIMGDKVLFALGQLLSNSIRDTDYVGRYGGEEFVIVFEECSLTDAASKLQTIKNAFADIVFSAENAKFNVTFSAGLVDLTKFENVQAAIVLADKGLYKAKSEGRNKIIVHNNK